MQGKKQLIIYIMVLVFVILLISSIVVFAKSQKQESTLEEKATSEIDYLSSKLIGTLNQFNGFSFMGYDIYSKKQQNQMSSSKEAQSSSANSNEQANDKTNNTANSNSETNNRTENTSNNSQTSKNNSADQINTSSNDSLNSNQNQILSFKGNYPTNWDKIEYQIEEIYHAWNTIVVDLHALNVNSDYILKFSDLLNQATKQIKKKNKKEAMNQLANLYQLLPEYARGYQSDQQWSNLLQIKSNIITAYCFASNEQWNEAKPKVQEAITLLTERINSVSNVQKQSQTITNKVYILVHELENAIDQKDKEIFFIHYSAIIEKVELL